MVAVRLTEPSPLTVLGSPAYFAHRGKPLRPEQLSEHACVNVRLFGGPVYRWMFKERSGQGDSLSFSMDGKGPPAAGGAQLVHLSVMDLIVGRDAS